MYSPDWCNGQVRCIDRNAVVKKAEQKGIFELVHVDEEGHIIGQAKKEA
jgi:hypothetical protein